MSEANLPYVLCGRETGVYKMAYREWGDPANPRVLICVHGLTRNSRDFERLAKTLSADYRVIAPDVLGRGESEWLRDPMGYAVPWYVQDMLVLVARLGVKEVGWLGTSMGGLIGMALAALPGTPIQRMVINDVGPVLLPEAIQRIAQYVGKAPPLANLDAARAYLRAISVSFGPHTDEESNFLTDMMLKDDGAGGLRLNYDPGIAAPFRAVMEGPAMVLWPYYDQIKCPTLLIRGAESDLLSEETAREMTQRGPKASRVDFAGVGHAPTFQHDDQIAAVAEFFKVGA